jgi:hypothetical protein
METVELEARFPVASFTHISKKLTHLDAREIWQGTELVRYFDTFDGSASAAGVDLRWKTCSMYPFSSHRVQRKTKLPDYDDGYRRRAKRRGESENLKPASEKEAEEALVRIAGGRPVVLVDTYQKHRSHYELQHPVYGNIAVELDSNITGLGDKLFIEIEGTIEAVDALVQEFNLNWDDVITMGYRSQIREAQGA